VCCGGWGGGGGHPNKLINKKGSSLPYE